MCPDVHDSLFVLLTCEHGGREVPAKFASCFSGHEAVLETHRGFDIGALGVAQRMAARLAVPIIFSTTTRLLVDLNRSIGQPDFFSEFTSRLTEEAREEIIGTYYRPHRASVERVIDAAVGAGHTVLHVGVHSCTDRLHDQTRELDIALLFDETRENEQALCERWRSQLHTLDDRLRSPFNEPYRGSDDGLTTTLRQRYAPYQYLGIEIEARQGIVGRQDEQVAIGDLLSASLRSTLDAWALTS